MATLVSFNTVDGYGLMLVKAKSGEKIKFPQPSSKQTPKIWLNAPDSSASLVAVNNLNFIMKTKTNDEIDLMVRYEL